MYDTFRPDRPMTLADFIRCAKACTRRITPMALIKKLQARQDVLLIDVREHSECEAGHIPGARLVSRSILEAAVAPTYSKRVPEVSSARNQLLAVYWVTGGRLAMAAAMLQMMDFENVLNLGDGSTRWDTEAMPEIHEASY